MRFELEWTREDEERDTGLADAVDNMWEVTARFESEMQ